MRGMDVTHRRYAWRMWLCSGVLTVCAALVLCAALRGSAAAAQGVSVQLDGELLSFSDAAPEIVDGRTFLPYRAVFTALGAQVSYEADSRTAVAVRDGVTVRVPIGSTRVTVTEDGESAELEMDVASYVKNGATYVPVRFMAQAMGCLVGWDGETRTVILIDAVKLAEEAVEGRSYSWLERYHDFLERFRTGSWAVEGELDYWLEEDGVKLAETTASFRGLTAGESRMELALTMTVDRSAWYEQQAAAMGLTLEQAGVSQDELYTRLELELRSDTDRGTAYLYPQTVVGQVDGLTQGSWVSMDGSAEVGGVDLTALLQVDSDVDAAAVVFQALAELELTHRDTAMTQARELAELTAANLSDVAFRESRGTRRASWTAGSLTTTLTLTLDESDGVTGYTLVQTLTDADGRVESSSSMDLEGSQTAEMTVTGGGQTAVLTQTGHYAATDEAPETRPPEGVTVTPYEG